MSDLRPCDGCTACCTAMTIDDLDAPAGKPCRHCGPVGCTRYATRFEVCRGFACSWAVADPALHADDRPDRCGVLIWFEGDVVRVLELWDDAFDSPRIQQTVDRYLLAFPISVIRHDGSRMWIEAAS